MKTIDAGVFQGFENLTSVTNGVGVRVIESWAFEESGIRSISFPNLVETKSEVFDDCKNLISVDCPKLEVIGINTFSDCPNLKDIKLSPKLKNIGCNAFENDKSLTFFIIPSTCTEIHSAAFAGTGLLEIQVPSTVKKIEGAIFYSCKNLKQAVLRNDGVLEAYTFEGCTNLEKVDLGTRITEIEPDAFLDCINLRSIVIPNSVKIINERAFTGCENLTEIRGYRGTEAERFANSIGVKFTPLEPTITLNASKITLYPVLGFNKTVFKVKREGTSSSVKFKSSNTSIATVSSEGTLTAKKPGTVTITVTCGSLKKTCKVYVKKPLVSVTSGTSITLKTGKTAYIKAKAVPAVEIKYISSDKRVATVNSKGKVYAKKKGTCYIKAYIDGAYKKVKVTVK